ncbi:hypothetical protein OIDMADRAFT_112078 [Oidiodendron maius Zn]|uniref:Kinetochore protein mis13 n=1 Tax=Oidiodendron maius (strain Zn) TaxID=913774 RepID=A0A0C3DUL7_OIDMZ|nr:hypothetical protein OIDMADRAFT_112078 [Oidiodendron maius Zn]
MTTVVRARIPLETLSMTQQPTVRRRSKRLAAYDEEDGDFVFSRGSKRTKTAQTDQEPVTVPALPPKKSRKVKDERGHDGEPVRTTKKPTVRRMDFATPKADPGAIKLPKRRKSTHTNETSKHQSRIETADYDTIDKGNVTRRSSLGMRGRRASSLIENGHSAIPHREVESSEFYKHIEAGGLSEPRRMKQLLTWTGERALGDKPLHGDPDSAAHLAARVIKESLLRDFGSKSEFSDWFSREESVPTKIIKKPNPRNVDIEENLARLEARIKRLKDERDQWKALAKPPLSLPPLFRDDSADLSPSDIDSSLLDPEQAAIYATVTKSSALDLRNEVVDRLKSIRGGIEFKVDHFADGIHKLEQFQETAGRVADKIQAIGAVRLEERDRKEKEAVGTRGLPIQEVLRSLSRILPESTSSTGGR